MLKSPVSLPALMSLINATSLLDLLSVLLGVSFLIPSEKKAQQINLLGFSSFKRKAYKTANAAS